MAMAIARERHIPLPVWLIWAALGVVGVFFAGYAARGFWGGAAAGAQGPAEPVRAAPAASKTTVVLSDEKYAAAKIGLAEVKMEGLLTEVGVPGQVSANMNRRVDVRARAMGIIREVRVLQGQAVKQGEVLAVLDSAEVGASRLALRNRQRELETARFEADWKGEVAAAVASLLPEMRQALLDRRRALPDDDEHVEKPSVEIQKRADTRVIEKQFAGKRLGAYRGALLQAYADFDIACHEEQKTASLKGDSIMGEHIPLVARHQREGVQAKLEGTMEQTQFDSELESKLANNRLRLAEAAVIDVVQRLRLLGVEVDLDHVLSRQAAAELHRPDAELDVTRYDLKAPFGGVIIKRTAAAVPSLKADVADVLFTLADLSSVWVNALVSESDLSKLPRIQDGTLLMTAAAYPGRVFRARLLSVGSVVDPQTRMVSILAQADNPDGALKDGLFTRIILDSEKREQALVAPAGAVQEIDAQRGVFIPASLSPSNRTFTFHPIEVGRDLGDRVVVTAGLKAGDVVVASGAFMLKSELVLANTPEED